MTNEELIKRLRDEGNASKKLAVVHQVDRPVIAQLLSNIGDMLLQAADALDSCAKELTVAKARIAELEKGKVEYDSAGWPINKRIAAHRLGVQDGTKFSGLIVDGPSYRNAAGQTPPCDPQNAVAPLPQGDRATTANTGEDCCVPSSSLAQSVSAATLIDEVNRIRNEIKRIIAHAKTVAQERDELRHDIARHVQIAADQSGEIAELRARLAEKEKK
jgi:hypothetical protein